jgi:hypothetical protein
MNDATNEKRARLPLPDPLGILEDLSGGRVVDPLRLAKEMRESKDDPNLAAAQVGKYVHHLEQAYLHAPCSGCVSLTESALVGAEIYRRMEEKGVTKEEVKENELDDVRGSVRARLAKMKEVWLHD